MLHFTGLPVMSPTLNYVDLTVITNTECAGIFGTLITSTKICTATTGGQSPCKVSFHLDILQKFTSCCPQHKTYCHHPDQPYSNQFSLFCISCAKCTIIRY